MSISKMRFLASEMWKHRLAYAFIAPFMICFIAFVFLPVLGAILLSFTFFNGVEAPRFIGWDNFSNLLSQDLLFLQYALPNTLKFAAMVGPCGYIAAFGLAWIIAQLPNKARFWYTLAIYAPSMTAGVLLTIVWLPMLSGDRLGFLNSLLLGLGLISEPHLWVTDKQYLMNSMVVVSIWSSMGVGFLAMLAGILNVNPEMYEAGRLDGIKSRLEEIWYITIPSMKPQMLFGAIMAIVGTFQSGYLGEALSNVPTTPQYSGYLIMNLQHDYGMGRLEMGYASAVSVFLLLFMYLANKLGWTLFGSKEDE